MEEHPVIRPGQRADIIMDIDERKEKINVRQSLVYDIVGDRVTLAQTSYPFTETSIGSVVTLTVLTGGQNDTKRFGVAVRASEILKDYRITSGERVNAVVAVITGVPFECNIRMHFRVQPGRGSGLEMRLEGKQVSIFDISLGGARVLVSDQFRVSPGDLLSGYLNIDGINYDCRARVLQLGKHYSLSSFKQSDALSYVTLQFLSMARETETRLSRKIREIERVLRQKELGLWDGQENETSR